MLKLFPIRKKNIRIPALILLSLLALSLVTGVFAWVIRNRTVEQTDIDMRIKGYSVSAIPFSAYKFDTATNVASQVFGDDIVLPVYDSVFVEQNDKCVLIYKAPVFGETIRNGDSFTVSLDLADQSLVTGLNDNNFRDSNVFENGSSTPAVADFVSNVVYVRCGVIDELQDDPSDADEIFETAHAFFSGTDGVEEESFLSYSGGVGTKKGMITFTVSDYTPAEILYVYLEVGYDPTLVDELIESRGMTISGSDVGLENKLPIDSDLDEFIFDAVSADS